MAERPGNAAVDSARGAEVQAHREFLRILAIKSLQTSMLFNGCLRSFWPTWVAMVGQRAGWR